MTDVVYSNIRDLMRMLNSIEPELKKQLVRDVKAVAKPVQAAIVARIPSSPPLKGMRNTGRLSWDNSVNYKGKRVPAKSVTVRFRSGNSRKSAITALVSVQANSPAVSMLDTAHKSSTQQGAAMIRNIIPSPRSRYVWPAAESALPQAEAAAKRILEAASIKISEGLR
jgi:hypothetical protein